MICLSVHFPGYIPRGGGGGSKIDEKGVNWIENQD